MERVIRLEHAGFAVLVGAGVGLMLTEGFWPPPGWLLVKLVLVACVILPVEAADMYLTHWWLPRALAGGGPPGAMERFDRWLWWAGVPLMSSALAVVLLAVLKPF